MALSDTSLLTCRDAAVALGTSKETVRRMARERRIPYVRLGRRAPLRFDAAEIARWIDAHRVGVDVVAS